MNTFEAIMIAERVNESTEEEYFAAWQHLIDTGVCWQLQGWFGRAAARLIEQGICTSNTDEA
jgi:fatty acid-binding protein DegV